MSAGDFDVEFENDILAQSLHSTEYMKRAATAIESHHFATEQHSWLWKVIQETWEATAERPSPALIARRARDEFDDEDERAAYMELATTLMDRKPSAPKAALNELERFKSFVNLQTAGEEMAKHLEAGRVEKAYDVMGNVIRLQARPSGIEVCDWMGGFAGRLTELKRRKEHPEAYTIIPTGLHKLDSVIDGIRPKELAMVMATTGRGKSIMCTHMGYTSVKKLKDIGTVHVSTEMHHFQVSLRYDARFTGFMHKKFKTFEFTKTEQRALANRIRKSFKRYAGRLKIISAPVRSATLAQVRRAISELQDEMDVPIKFVVFDSGDHLLPERSYKETRHERADIYWGMKGWAEEDDIAIFGSTQAGKQAAKRTAVSEDSSESYDTSRIADIIISLNKPESKTRATPKVEIGEEDDDKYKGEIVIESASDLELFLTKYRDGEGNLRIPLETDLRRMLIKDGADPKKREAA